MRTRKSKGDLKMSLPERWWESSVVIPLNSVFPLLPPVLHAPLLPPWCSHSSFQGWSAAPSTEPRWWCNPWCHHHAGENSLISKLITLDSPTLISVTHRKRAFAGYSGISLSPITQDLTIIFRKGCWISSKGMSVQSVQSVQRREAAHSLTAGRRLLFQFLLLEDAEVLYSLSLSLSPLPISLPNLSLSLTPACHFHFFFPALLPPFLLPPSPSQLSHFWACFVKSESTKSTLSLCSLSLPSSHWCHLHNIKRKTLFLLTSIARTTAINIQLGWPIRCHVPSKDN